MFKKLSFLILFAVFGFTSTVNAQDISIYLYVDEEIRSQRGWDQQDLEDRLANLVFETNQSYLLSDVDIELKMEGYEEVNLSSFEVKDDIPNIVEVNADALLSAMQNQTGVFQNSLVNADRAGYDYLYTFVHEYDKNLCGKAAAVNTAVSSSGIFGQMIGNISSTRWAIASSDIDCGFETFAHELGHTMGLAHGDQVAVCHEDSAHSNAITSTAKGWGQWDCDRDTSNNAEYDEFGTLMVGNYIFGRWIDTDGDGKTDTYERHTRTANPKIELFSNPNLSNAICGPDDVCGDVNNGNAAGVLNNYKSIYASHEAPNVGWLSYTDDNLTACLRGSNYIDTEVANLSAMDCSNRSIRNLDGIQGLTSTNSFALLNNSITSLSPLMSIANERPIFVNLTGNDNAICQHLDALESNSNATIIRPSQCFDLAVMVAVNHMLLN